MRFTGKLKTWNEERGFGFITPVEGGQDVFVHVSELPRGMRPDPGTLYSFEVAMGPQGKKKAVRVQLVRPQAGPPDTRGRVRSAERRTAPAGLGWIGSIVIFCVLAAVVWGVFRREVGRHNSLAVPPTSSAYSCDGRTHCSQMTSCAEAKFFLKYCPGTAMDGNNDGVPCQAQWCQ